MSVIDPAGVARVRAAAEEILRRDPSTTVVLTDAITLDAYQLGARGLRTTLWLHPDHETYLRDGLSWDGSGTDIVGSGPRPDIQ